MVRGLTEVSEAFVPRERRGSVIHDCQGYGLPHSGIKMIGPGCGDLQATSSDPCGGRRRFMKVGLRA